MSETPAIYGTDNTRDKVREWIGAIPEQVEPDDVQFVETRHEGQTLKNLQDVAEASGLTLKQMVERIVEDAVNPTNKEQA